MQEENNETLGIAIYCEKLGDKNIEEKLAVDGKIYDRNVAGLTEQYEKYQQESGNNVVKIYRESKDKIIGEGDEKKLTDNLAKSPKIINIGLAYHDSKLDPESPEIKDLLTKLVKSGAEELNIDIISCFSAAAKTNKFPDRKTIEDWKKVIEECDLLNGNLKKINITGCDGIIVIRNSKEIEEGINQKIKEDCKGEYENNTSPFFKIAKSDEEVRELLDICHKIRNQKTKEECKKLLEEYEKKYEKNVIRKIYEIHKIGIVQIFTDLDRLEKIKENSEPKTSGLLKYFAGVESEKDYRLEMPSETFEFKPYRHRVKVTINGSTIEVEYPIVMFDEKRRLLRQFQLTLLKKNKGKNWPHIFF